MHFSQRCLTAAPLRLPNLQLQTLLPAPRTTDQSDTTLLLASWPSIFFEKALTEPTHDITCKELHHRLQGSVALTRVQPSCGRSCAVSSRTTHKTATLLWSCWPKITHPLCNKNHRSLTFMNARWSSRRSAEGDPKTKAVFPPLIIMEHVNSHRICMYQLLKEERPHWHIFVLRKDKSEGLLLWYKMLCPVTCFLSGMFSDFVVGH